MRFRIEYSPAAVAHLKALMARQQSIVLDGVVRHLSVDPNAETRHRKRMRPNPLASWELRLGALRVYFDIVSEPEPLVVVLAVGVKDGNVVRIGKRSIDL
jgi:mRNA-degrading endonuclease RelE of RelBE toxin-antitoxin system